MLICDNCNLKEICKTYYFIVNNTYAKFNIYECKYNKSIENKTIKNTNFNYQGKAKPDLREVEKKIKHIEDKPKPKIMNCPTCNGSTYEDDIKICEDCGKTVCPGCSTIDNGHIYCDECWKKH
jgi:hypothetical protein